MIKYKIIISLIVLVLIVSTLNICNANTLNYDISDYINHLDGKPYVILYSERDRKIYLVVGYLFSFGVIDVDGEYYWATSRLKYYETGFGSQAYGVSVLTYDSVTSTFVDRKEYSPFKFSSGQGTKILYSSLDVGCPDDGKLIFEKNEVLDTNISFDDGKITGYSFKHTNTVVTVPRTCNYIGYDYNYAADENCDYVITYRDNTYYLFFYHDTDLDLENYFALGAHDYENLGWHPALYNFNGVKKGLETDSTAFKTFKVYQFRVGDNKWSDYDCTIENNVWCRGDYNIFGMGYDILFSSKDIYNADVSTVKEGNYYYLDTSTIIFNKHEINSAVSSKDLIENGDTVSGGGVIGSAGTINKDSATSASSDVSEGFNSVKDKFNFVDDIKNNANDMFQVIKDTNSNSKFKIKVNSKFYSGELTILDLSWYEPYRNYGNNIICIFAYCTFIWEIYKNLPSIIEGFSASTYSTAGYVADIDKNSNKQRIGFNARDSKVKWSRRSF